MWFLKTKEQKLLEQNGLPEGWVYYKLTPRNRQKFRDHWVYGNPYNLDIKIKQEFCKQYGEDFLILNVYPIGIWMHNEFYFCFKNKADLMLFKLTWL
jgi:hypothetical protein